jgi:hypothetical protein
VSSVVALASIVGGYVVIAWLFYVMVYRPSRRERAVDGAVGRDARPEGVAGAEELRASRRTATVSPAPQQDADIR